MPTIDKISSLRNYQAVLDKVKPGSPVFLTKNGSGRYTILDTEEYDSLYRAAFAEFFKQLDSNRIEANQNGWIDEDTIRKRFGLSTSV